LSTLARRVNRVLGQTVGLQLTPGRGRRVALSEEWFNRLVFFNQLVERIAEVPGDIVECGVAAGSSLALLTSLTRANGQCRHVWGFDSWAGLPSPDARDLGVGSVAAAGIFAEASPEKVMDELAAYGLDAATTARLVRLVPGFFAETLPAYEGEIALLHVDVDLYQSYRDCLECLWPRVQPGGIVAFDEYGEPDSWPGARRAVDEFLRSAGLPPSRLRSSAPSGKWWLVKD
jgi:hypothetical protein